MQFIKRLLIAVTLLYIILCITVFVLQEKIIFQPIKLPESYAFSFPQPFTELTLATKDGGKLSFVEFPPSSHCAEERGKLLFLHGNASTIVGYGGRSESFTSRCWSTSVPDYRPFGKSTGPLSEDSLQLDAQTAYDHLRKGTTADHIVIYGQSLGTGIATKLASQVEEKALILEAPYLSMLAMAEERYPYLPVSAILRFPLRSDLAIPQVKGAVYIFHGTKDGLIPFSQGEALSKLTRSPTQFISLESGGHHNIPSFPDYNRILDEVLGASPQIH